LLRKVNLVLEKDVSLIQIGAQTSRFAALLRAAQDRKEETDEGIPRPADNQQFRPACFARRVTGGAAKVA
jgi:hypothetical protein